MTLHERNDDVPRGLCARDVPKRLSCRDIFPPQLFWLFSKKSPICAAPATAAPVLSTTLPRSEVRADCAFTVAALNNRIPAKPHVRRDNIQALPLNWSRRIDQSLPVAFSETAYSAVFGVLSRDRGDLCWRASFRATHLLVPEFIPVRHGPPQKSHGFPDREDIGLLRGWHLPFAFARAIPGLSRCFCH